MVSPKSLQHCNFACLTRFATPPSFPGGGPGYNLFYDTIVWQPIEDINGFLEQRIEHISDSVTGTEERQVDEGELDALFSEMLQSVAVS